MKTDPLILVAPDFGALDRIARRPEPAVLWPVGHQTLAAHWLDHAVRLGCRRVVIHALDRPAEVRAALGDGGYWSLALEISSQPPPTDAISMVRLPMEGVRTEPTTPGQVLAWWFDLNRRWLEKRNAILVSIDEARADGGWVGPQAKIHPSAKLIAPYWIGAGSEIGPGCEVGPHALISPGCVLEEDVRVDHSLILPRTFLGSHLDVRSKVVDGATLLDLVTGIRVEIHDDFVASSLVPAAPRVAWCERILAAILWLPASLCALSAGPASTETVGLRGGSQIALSTRARGPLLVRRAGWLRHVIAGRLRLVGVLPRAAAPDLPPDSRALLEGVTPGTFALSDLHGVHTAADADEAWHAIYQAAAPAADRTVWRNLVRLCRLRPTSSAS